MISYADMMSFMGSKPKQEKDNSDKLTIKNKIKFVTPVAAKSTRDHKVIDKESIPIGSEIGKVVSEQVISKCNKVDSESSKLGVYEASSVGNKQSKNETRSASCANVSKSKTVNLYESSKSLRGNNSDPTNVEASGLIMEDSKLTPDSVASLSPGDSSDTTRNNASIDWFTNQNLDYSVTV